MFKLLSLDNKESKGQAMVNKKHNFIFDGHQFTFGTITSSRVKSININEKKEVVVKTKNSTYVFERIMS